MANRAVVVLVLFIGIWGNAWSEELVLVCDYPGLPPTSQSSSKIVPRQVAVDFTKSTVTWDGLDVDVAAEISERMVKFSHEGFNYSISRLTGQIRFSSPSELARWQRYRQLKHEAAAMGGQSTTAVGREVNERLETELTAREQVGDCSPASKPKF